MILPLVTALSASGATVRVTVAWEADGPQLVSAVRTDGDAVGSVPGDLELVDGAGRVVGSAAIPDPRIRSVVTPDGGETVVLPRAIARFTVSWPEGAAGLRLRGKTTTPRPAPPTAATLVHDGGPPDERLDLVILGDGYTADQQDAFAEDVRAVVDYLLSIEPYDRYADLLNVWQVSTASNQTGVSHAGDPRNTAFGCAYDCAGIERLVCCDDADVLQAVDRSVPDADGILVLLNDAEYGGSGGFTYATAYVGEPDGVQVAAHELGHSLVGLWDEYSYGVSGSGEGPNCSRDPEGSWDAWLPQVGSFPECSFLELYRPTDEGCMMRTLQDGYCPVCRERVVLAMHEGLPGLIRSTDPAPGEVPAETAAITVETRSDPARLTFSWTMDGAEVSSSPTLDLECSGLQGEVSLHVTDDTRWVRTDPEGKLADDAGPWVVHAERCARPEPAPASCGCRTGAGGGWSVALMLLLVRRRGVHASRAAQGVYGFWTVGASGDPRSRTRYVAGSGSYPSRNVSAGTPA